MVYRLQGVDINDKHFEIIIRQMLRRRRIVDPGDSRFLVNEEVEIEELQQEIDRIKEEGGKIPKAEPILVGISKAALTSRSWISAASFQETTKVLTDAACEGKVDDLRGIKENVIIGNLPLPGLADRPLASWHHTWTLTAFCLQRQLYQGLLLPPCTSHPVGP